MEDTNEQIMSVMIDKELYSNVRTHCYSNGFKIKKFIADALREKLNGKKSTKRS